jgi:hypothetical protein
MHRSSETIGAIAAALAKAQGELTNPEKSLTATISAPGPRGGDRTFRYASLSSGLEIVRKSLGRQEIAAVQTTAIDTEAGLVRLNTVLAHSSGEWISSEWPVCPVAESATPHRLGAALTYARRYALFTLVGIAGEDDLDAPDITSAACLTQGTEQTIRTTAVPAQHQENHSAPSPKFGNGSSQKFLTHKPAAVLRPQESAAMREKLVSEVSKIPSAEQLTEWASRELPIKNTLAVDDAKLVEDAFQAQLELLSGPSTAAGNACLRNEDQTRLQKDEAKFAPAKVAAEAIKSAGDCTATHTGEFDNPSGTAVGGIAKSMLVFGEPRRQRNKAHLKFVASKACLICGRQPSDPHHLGFAQPRALSRKVSDEFTVPLCRTHHREVHRCLHEREWWSKFGLDPLSIASTLWAQTRPLRPEAQRENSEQVSLPQAAALDAKPIAPLTKGKRNFKTKPIARAGSA